MKKQKLLRFGLFVLLNLSAASPVLSDEHVHQHSAGGELPAGEPAKESVYLTESEWQSSTGEVLQLRELRGKVQVLALFYASCTAACPVIVDSMKMIESSLSEQQRERVDFVLVTFDPENDTREVLENYREKRSLSSGKWRLLRGDPADVQELAVLLGARYKKIGPGNFSHSNLVILLDEEGRIVSRATGLAQAGNIIHEVRTRLGEAPEK